MPFAIALRLDPAAAAPLAAMWQALAAAGIDNDRFDLGYPPHVTLAVYPDDAPAKTLGKALENMIADWRALPVTLAGIGLFPPPSAALWAAPAPTPALLARHAAWLAALPDVPPHPHYRSGAWVPHVTLSGVLADPVTALRVLLPHWRPVSGLLDRVELVRFRPVEVLQSYALPA